jgi:hypothetical protein
MNTHVHDVLAPLKDLYELKLKYPDGYFFQNTVFRVDKTKPIYFKYIECCYPPDQSNRPIALANLELQRSPTLREFSKSQIEAFLKEYALYRQKGGLQKIENCITPEAMLKCKQYLGFDERKDPKKIENNLVYLLYQSYQCKSQEEVIAEIRKIAMVDKGTDVDPHDVIDCFHKVREFAETISDIRVMPNANVKGRVCKITQTF